MIKVLPIQTKEKQQEVCQRCGVTFDPDLLAYSAEFEGELAGVCQFKLTSDGGIIYDLSSVLGKDNTDALFVMGRGTLNFIDLCGIHRAFFDGVADDKLLRAIGFEKNADGRYEIDLEGFFNEPCQHHKCC